MAWKDDSRQILRVKINDLDSPYKYSDDRLNQILVVGAFCIIEEIPFSVDYSITLSSGTLTPEPTESDPYDNGFIRLVALKSAVLLIGGAIRKLGASSMRVTDGPSTIDVSSAYSSMKDLYDELLDEYEKEKMIYTMTIGGGRQVVTTPITYDMI